MQLQMLSTLSTNIYLKIKVKEIQTNLETIQCT